ncbi:DUF2243 domain-containing protein [Jiangella gansuensis]|uniref:DUF2243 domain-containing protein n=1 Tax=Jiangella gansuensis TaxID=281473 RepID=UPI0004B412DB|nr:DUF2243 domain-containing protein [Jiangella gansuensis]
MVGDNGRADAPEPMANRSLTVGAMIGVAVMAAVDEVVFHQLLGWHHFYDRSATDVALMSDGLLHAAELVLLVAGFVLLSDLRRRGTLAVGAAWAGVLLGSGAFQVWDGLVHHKVLRLHQVRYGVDLLPYDMTWNAVGVVLLAAGVALARRSRRSSGGRRRRAAG